MNELLTVLPFSANDGVAAEKLLDWIFLVNKRTQKRHCLLVAAGDVHGEMCAKIKIAAEVAFKSVEIITAPNVPAPNKVARVNTIFRTAAEHVQRVYRVPWFWLEPDCVPLTKNWFDKIEDAHFDQPRRYSGSWLKSADLFMARVACYPPDAITDLGAFLTGPAMFNIAAGPIIIPRSTKTRLCAELAFVDESTIVPETALLVHGDKNGVLMQKHRDQFEQAATRKK